MSEDNFNPIHESKKNLYFPAFKKIPCYYKFFAETSLFNVYEPHALKSSLRLLQLCHLLTSVSARGERQRAAAAPYLDRGP